MVFHSKPSDHLEKLRRVVDRLARQEMHADDMDDFCKTAWHLIELVEKDGGSTREMRKRASRLRSDPDLELCRHAANVEKHGSSRGGMKVAFSHADVQAGYGIGRYGQAGYGVGEQSITLRFVDGTEHDAHEFASAVLQKWELVFAP